jgi:hypothetical protein
MQGRLPRQTLGRTCSLDREANDRRSARLLLANAGGDCELVFSSLPEKVPEKGVRPFSKNRSVSRDY